MKTIAAAETTTALFGKSQRVLAWLPPLLLFCLSLPVYLVLTAQFDELAVFQQYNLLFDADPNARLGCFANGWGGEGRSLAHPNLCNLINPPIRVLALLLKTSGLAAPGLERQLALLVAPLFASASLVLLYACLLLLGCRPAYAFSLGLLAGASVSQLIFGSIPDHFILGGFSLTLTAWLLLYSIRQGRLPLLPWIGAGALVASITITNFLLFLCALAAACATLPERAQALRRAVLAALLAIAAVGAIKLPLDRAYAEHEGLSQARDFATAYLQHAPLQRLADFPLMAVASFAAPEILQVPQRLQEDGRRYHFQLTFGPGHYSSPLGLAAAVAIAALFASALWQAWHRRRPGFPAKRAVLLFIGAALSFNALFHAFWGSEYFLYSQHWLFACYLLFGFMDQPAQTRTALPLALCLLAAGLVLGNNFLVLQDIMRQLAAS